MTRPFTADEAADLLRRAGKISDTLLPDLTQALVVAPHAPLGDEDREVLTGAWLDWLEGYPREHLWIGDAWVCQLDAPPLMAGHLSESMSRNFGGVHVAHARRFDNGAVQVFPRHEGGRA